MLKVMGSSEIPRSEIKRVLIVATSWVGDAVISMPAVEAVKKNFPDSHITVLARPWVAPLFESHPAVDHVIARDDLETVRGMLRAGSVIRNEGFDLAILMRNAFRAALLARLGRCKFRVGYSRDGRGFLLTHKVILTEEILKAHQVEYYLSILRAMDWEAPSCDPSVYVTPRDEQRARELVSMENVRDGDFLLGLSPGAIYGEAKRWPPERFARIGDWAAERWGAKVIIVGSKGEKHICEALRTAMKHRALSYCGETTLGETMGIIRLCRFFVTNDSGLMHVSAALGVPTLAIFGSTDPVATGPRGPRTKVVRHDMDCAPCLKRECSRNYRCLLSIEPEKVWADMERLREGGF